MSRRRQVDSYEIDIAPMLDIVFIMLIFFIVTTSFVADPGFDPERPSAMTAQANPAGNFLVALSPDGKIWIAGETVSLNDVRGLAERMKRQTPESSAIVMADQAVASGLLLDVMDQIKAAGISDISIAARQI